jgi:O-methyltransferase
MKVKIRYYIKRIIYNFPLIKKILNKLKFQQNFLGWGMSTSHYPPWNSSSFPDDTSCEFNSINNKIVKAVLTRKIQLLQFVEFNTLEILNELMWRHFIVVWSVRYVIAKAQSGIQINLVECGVCDGLTLRFALEMMKLSEKEFKAFAYDAWGPMKESLLLDSEKSYVGQYGQIAIENAKKNLSDFSGKVVFNQGYIPHSLLISENPDICHWLHIDLNSARPTLEALQFFYDKIPEGGVILFDDYGWEGYRESKQVIDQYLKTKPGQVLALPTGQAIYFK